MSNQEKQQKGIEIATLYTLTKQKGAWLVPSSRGNKSYRVTVFGRKSACTCPDYNTHGDKCKHIYAVEHTQSIKRPRGRPSTKNINLKVEKRKTYPQDWPLYNHAQTNEKDMFLRLLKELCGDVKELDQSNGRPRMPIADALFSIVFKVYTKYSARRYMSDLRDVHEKGYISKISHFNTILNYLELPELYPVLCELVHRSSLPMRDLETDFAADASGFSSNRYTRWFDKQYGKVAIQQDWVKLHMMCGVQTNIVTAVEIHEERTHDSIVFPELMGTTAKSFRIREVAGDKGYLSVKNMEAVEKHGGTPYFAFKTNSTGLKGGIWDKMYYKFSLNHENYMKHYHKRSNAETTFSMIKRKFESAVKSKTDVAMKNEVLCKVLCHNICCVIEAVYKLGIEVDFAVPLKAAA